MSPSSSPVLLLVCANLLWPLVGRAQEAASSCEHARYVLVETAASFDESLAEEVRKDMSAELSPRGFGVCAMRATRGEVAAEVRLGMSDVAMVSIQIDDNTTGKRVARDVTLLSVPSEGKALAIAIAVDELLRASWAELTLRRTEPAVPAEPVAPLPPVPVERSVKPVNARASGSTVVLPRRGAREPIPLSVAGFLGYAHASSPWDSFGVDARVRLEPLRRGLLEFGLGVVAALDEDVRAGVASARGVSASALLGGCTRQRRRLAGCFGARSTLYWLQFRGSGQNDARGFREDLGAVLLSGVGQLSVLIHQHLSAMLELSLGGTALGARTTDGARTVMALDGFVLGLAAGVGFEL